MAAIFEKQYLVPADDENEANHVDNQVYLRWMNEVAIEHSAACGWGMENYVKQGSCFVVKSHFIEYLAPTFKGEKLLFMTWISSMEGKRSTRQYLFFKTSDSRPFMRAETQWVHADMATGRPVEIPEKVLSSFTTVSDAEVKARVSQLK